MVYCGSSGNSDDDDNGICHGTKNGLRRGDHALVIITVGRDNDVMGGESLVYGHSVDGMAYSSVGVCGLHVKVVRRTCGCGVIQEGKMQSHGVSFKCCGEQQPARTWLPIWNVRIVSAMRRSSSASCIAIETVHNGHAPYDNRAPLPSHLPRRAPQRCRATIAL